MRLDILYLDTDSDGFGKNEDAFPFDLKEWQDSVGNGIVDNSDYYPYDENRWEGEWP